MKEFLFTIAWWGGIGLMVWLMCRVIRSFVRDMIFMIGGK